MDKKLSSEETIELLTQFTELFEEFYFRKYDGEKEEPNPKDVLDALLIVYQLGLIRVYAGINTLKVFTQDDIQNVLDQFQNVFYPMIMKSFGVEVEICDYKTEEEMVKSFSERMATKRVIDKINFLADDIPKYRSDDDEDN